ncbi:hypothetical protein V491_07693, partial [Pseudogymnoascus sp. VKM F-3775]
MDDASSSGYFAGGYIYVYVLFYHLELWDLCDAVADMQLSGWAAPTAPTIDPLIAVPEGPDPVWDISRNGGPDDNTPPLDLETGPIMVKTPSKIFEAGHTIPATGLDHKYTRLCLDRPATAAIRCWLNNYPKAWVKAGIDGLRMVEARLTLFFWLTRMAMGWMTTSSSTPMTDPRISTRTTAPMRGKRTCGGRGYPELSRSPNWHSVWVNEGRESATPSGWKFKEIGQIASRLRSGARARMADINNDGNAYYIFLKPSGGTIYRKQQL